MPCGTPQSRRTGVQFLDSALHCAPRFGYSSLQAYHHCPSRAVLAATHWIWLLVGPVNGGLGPTRTSLHIHGSVPHERLLDMIVRVVSQPSRGVRAAPARSPTLRCHSTCCSLPHEPALPPGDVAHAQSPLAWVVKSDAGEEGRVHSHVVHRAGDALDAEAVVT